MRIAVSHGTVESLVKDMLAQEDLGKIISSISSRRLQSDSNGELILVRCSSGDVVPQLFAPHTKSRLLHEGRSNSFFLCLYRLLSDEAASFQDHLMPTFLHRALGRTIQKINSERICIEIRYPISKGEAYEKRVRAVECGRKELLSLLDMCWNDIYSARGLVPRFGSSHPTVSKDNR
jgi:hypothetical protein